MRVLEHWRWGLAALVALMLSWWVVSGGGGRQAPSSYAVRYEVEGIRGPTRALVTYATANGTEQERLGSLPWSKQLAAAPGQQLSVSAQDREGNDGISVRIVVEGKEFRRSQSRGAYTVATATGTCCP